MDSEIFIGRQQELNEINDLLHKKSASKRVLSIPLYMIWELPRLVELAS